MEVSVFSAPWSAPLLSDKYDLMKDSNYESTAEADNKNWFDIEKYLDRKLKLRERDEYIVIEA